MANAFDIYRMYQALPAPLRGIADAGYRLIPERLLRPPRVNAFKDELAKTQWLPPDELKMLQFLRLKDLCIHAGEHTQYYKRVFHEHGFKPREMKSPEDLRVLPLLTRDDIITYGSELRSDAYGKGDVYDVSTSGSTGKYLAFVQSKEFFDREFAFTERYKQWMGARPKWKLAVFYNAIMRHPVKSDTHPPYERYRNRLIMSQFHTDDESLRFYVEMLNRFQPDYFIIFPSTAVSLTRYCTRTGAARFSPRSIMCYSENLRDEHRREIEEYWTCRVYNRYGHGEGCISAGDCSEGGMHLSEEFGYTEFLRADGTQAQPGEPARMIGTGLYTHAMPFIRYDSGDFGVLSGDRCTCGRTLQVLDRVDGRGDDMVFAKDGKKVSALRSIFVRTSGIAASQIVQEREGEIIIRLVPDSDYTPAVQDVILANLRSDTGDAFDARFELVDEVERTPSGKVRLVLNKIRR